MQAIETQEYRVSDIRATTNALAPQPLITFVKTIGERIAWARKERGLTQAQLASAVGISQSAIGSYEAGHRARPRELLSIARALDASADWMETGEGDWRAPPGRPAMGAKPAMGAYPPDEEYERPMFSRRVAAHEPARQYPTLQPILAWEHEEDLPEGDFVLVPRLNVHLGAGPGRDQVEIELAEASPLAFRADWVRQKRLRPNKLAAMSAAGDSMVPTIFDGDSLVIDTGETTVQDGKVYALWYDGGERVKRLFRLPGGGLRIKSDNPAFDTIELGPDYAGHVRIIGRVVHRSGTGGL